MKTSALPVSERCSINTIRTLTLDSVAAWQIEITERNKPTMLVLGRQGVPVLQETKDAANTGVAKGAYVLSSAAQSPEGF